MKIILALILSYVCGSIPFGYLIGKLVKGIDIRQHGSGNIGATNVVRVVGWPGGIVAFVADFAKGLLPPYVLYLCSPAIAMPWLILAALLTVCGHSWPVFLQFKGGKGVATSLGALTALAMIVPQLWLCLGLALLIWISVFGIFRYVSLASLAAAIVFLLSALFVPLPFSLRLLAGLLALVIIVRHRSNIGRLLSRKEHRF